MEGKNKAPHYDISKTSGLKYNIWDVVHILNIEQAKFYMANGVPLIDLDFSKSRSHPDRTVVVFIFNREDTREAYDTWCKRASQMEY